MQLPVKLFARARDLAGTAELSLALPEDATVAELRRRLAEAYPALADLLRRCAVAVDDDFAADTLVLTPTSRVAILPPVSGG
jgi:molybdopterin synthase sulfur carrier subunit